MRIGRILKQGDILFADSQKPCAVSAGGVFLARQDIDDYARFRVPDTNCPVLSEPNQPLDSGVADEAEPNRWSILAGNPNTGNKWVLLQSTDMIGLSYTVYSGDFMLEYEGRVVSVTGSQDGAYFDGVGLEFKIDDNNLVCVALGYTPGGRGWGWRALIGGVESKSIGPAVLSDVVFRVQVQRTGNAWSARFWRGDTQEWTSWSSIGNVGTGQVTLTLKGLRFNIVPYGSSNRDVTVKYHYLLTLSGAPSSVTVATPVVDMQQPVAVQVSSIPQVGALDWRASNTPFAPGDSSPSWDNPSGEYRYWQARVTWTDPTRLLERIELLTDAQRLMLFRRFRDYWTIWNTSQGKIVRTDDKAIFGSGTQIRADDGWHQVSDDERVTTVR